MNIVRRIGLIGLGLSALGIVLLTALIHSGISGIGPCGFDPLGLVIFLGILVTGGIGLLFTLAEFLRRLVQRFSGSAG